MNLLIGAKCANQEIETNYRTRKAGYKRCYPNTLSISASGQGRAGESRRDRALDAGVIAQPRRAEAALPLKLPMKKFVRLFFKTLRVVLGPVMLFKEKLTRPKGLTRPQPAQEKVDRQCQSLVLYQYKTCPFSIKVRQEISRLSLKIKRIDAQQEGCDRQELLQRGGQAKVPCLKITDHSGNSQWLYDSEKIVAYLRGRFVSA